jgi:hypothetical protein
MGKYGTRVNMQIQAAGTAIIKLNDIAFALSSKPTLFTCLRKNTKASYNGTPQKPGRTICLLL